MMTFRIRDIVPGSMIAVVGSERENFIIFHGVVNAQYLELRVRIGTPLTVRATTPGYEPLEETDIMPEDCRDHEFDLMQLRIPVPPVESGVPLVILQSDYSPVDMTARKEPEEFRPQVPTGKRAIQI